MKSVDCDLDTLALVARGIDVAIHKHNAVQMVVSLDRPYPAILNNHQIPALSGFLIDSNIPHACQSSGSTVLVISIDAACRKGRLLRKNLLGDRKFVLLEEVLSESVVCTFKQQFWKADKAGDFDHLALVRELSTQGSSAEHLDQRIQNAIDLIQDNLHDMLPFPEIAEQVKLSESRLRHLFQVHIGIPMTTYVLWLRIKRVLKVIAMPQGTLAEAAYEAGFSDQAHLTRTFKRMFGIAPSLMRENSELLQVFG